MPEWFWPESKPEPSIAARVGRVLHWLGYGLAIWILIVAGTSNTAHLGLVEAIGLAAVFAVVGRMARYIFASE